MKMDLAIQLSTNDKKREERIRDLKDFKSKSSFTQAKRGEEIVAVLSAV